MIILLLLIITAVFLILCILNREKININTQTSPYITNGIVNESKLFSKEHMNHDVQKENLLLLKSILDRHHMTYYIDCGTLLGAVRDGGFIKGDTDVDIMLSRNQKEKLQSILPELENNGFIIFRAFLDKNLPMSLLRKDEYIDFYSLWSDITFELKKYEFIGTTFNIPKYYDEYLQELYGDWKTPQHGGKGPGNWEKGMPAYIKKYG